MPFFPGETEFTLKYNFLSGAQSGAKTHRVSLVVTIKSVDQN